MKTLIFLIIICTCVAVGQGRIKGFNNPECDEIKKRNEQNGIVNTQNEWAEWTGGQKAKQINTTLTLEDWDEYVKECWNDSTEAGICISWIPDSIQISSGGFIPKWKTTYKQEYVHRHRPTFEGFIEWLKRKNNGTE